ncbi:MAG: phage protein Gp36 family protein [Bacteroidales bacterium]
MKYITREDIEDVIQDRLFAESVVNVANNQDIMISIESKAIDLVISYISTKYDTSKIFGDAPIRNGILIQILSQIVAYRAVRRNSARKVPEDYVEVYKDAIKMLERIQLGAIKLENVPAKTSEQGNTSKLMYGNNRNSDYFI